VQVGETWVWPTICCIACGWNSSRRNVTATHANRPR
jgi:hypothetical protein